MITVVDSPSFSDLYSSKDAITSRPDLCAEDAAEQVCASPKNKLESHIYSMCISFCDPWHESVRCFVGRARVEDEVVEFADFVVGNIYIFRRYTSGEMYKYI